MKTMTKIALVSVGLLSVGTLTACQSTNSTATPEREGRMAHSMHGKHARLSPEQREQWQQLRTERHQMMQQIKTACKGKAAGQVVQVKAGEKTVNGTCSLVFTPERQQLKHSREHRPMRGDVRQFKQHGPQTGALTDAKRAELVKQYDQRLAQHQARQQAMANACNGKTAGQTVQIKLGDKSVNGQCSLRFKPNTAVTIPAKVA